MPAKCWCCFIEAFTAQHIGYLLDRHSTRLQGIHLSTQKCHILPLFSVRSAAFFADLVGFDFLTRERRKFGIEIDKHRFDMADCESFFVRH
ncbi:hypothetical protein C6Q17_12365 [Burkholderia contaminans]|nr:hypothetical protein C6Q17_12365 [Burkholderia contaminans]